MRESDFFGRWYADHTAARARALPPRSAAWHVLGLSFGVQTVRECSGFAVDAQLPGSKAIRYRSTMVRSDRSGVGNGKLFGVLA